MASNDTLMVMDGELETQCQGAQGRLTAAGATLRLFTNDRDPTPEDSSTDYTDATYDGYATVDLEGEWTTVAREEAGVWYTQTEIYEFSVVAAGGTTTQTIEGIYITDNAGGVICAGRLPAAVTLTDGGDPLRLRVVYRQYAGLVLASIVLA